MLTVKDLQGDGAEVIRKLQAKGGTDDLQLEDGSFLLLSLNDTANDQSPEDEEAMRNSVREGLSQYQAGNSMPLEESFEEIRKQVDL